jgi:exodeoxyribonuclease VII large subunit
MDAGTLTVTQLSQGIDAALASWFGGELWVQGEIDSLRRSNNGHVYFQLVDRSDEHNRANASIDVTLFDAARRHVNDQLRTAGGVRMTDGMQVRIRGRLEYYAPQGRVQLRMSGIDPAFTLALLVTERDRVLARLDADGLLERNRSIGVPALPLRIGLATSDGSAAMSDFIHELEASGFAWTVCLAHIPVQGRGADRMIAGAIDALAAAEVDVIALVRGGGSRLDLATFDGEVVARAVAAAVVPVWTGIGHEIDTSVADVVAHTTYKTPTACAVALVRHVQDWLDRIEETWSRIPARVTARVDRSEGVLDAEQRALVRTASARIDAATQHATTRARRIHASARHQLTSSDRHVAGLYRQLSQSSEAVLRQAEHRLVIEEATANGADPVRLMRRGWSITRTRSGSVVRDVTAVAPGDRLVSTVANGVIVSDVERAITQGEREARRHGG